MNLQIYNPNSIFSSFWRDFDDFYDGVLVSPRSKTNNFAPNTDVVEKDDQYYIKIDLPGVKKEDLSIEVKNNVLTVKGTRAEEKENKSEKLFKKERFVGSFSRSFNVEETDQENIKADYKDGVLTLDLPKKKTESYKKISIN